jgi:hypothetical protein
VRLSGGKIAVTGSMLPIKKEILPAAGYTAESEGKIYSRVFLFAL